MSRRTPIEPSAFPGLDAPEATPRTLLAIIALGLGFDLAFNGQRPGISIPLFTILLAVALRTIAVRSIQTDVLLAGAVVLSIFPALRATPELIAIDVLAASALIGLAVTADLGTIGSETIVGLVRRGIAILQRTLFVPRFLAGPFAEPTERRRTRAALRAFIVAAPVLALFAGLLASGDRVFARLLSSVLPEWNAGSILSHIAMTLAGAVLVAILWRAALGDHADSEPRTQRRIGPLLGFAEWTSVLAGIDLLFATFVVVQLTYLFGGHRRVVVTPGLSYAEYARSGFFQLAAAAGLTVVVILGTWDAGRRDDARHERWFRVLVTTMVGLTGVVLASAVTRLALYEGTFGFTINRFFGYVAIISIGGVLLVLLGAIWTGRRERVVAGFLAVALMALLALNVINPEPFVAQRNIARFEAIGRIDVSYLGFELGDDAVPVVAPLLDRLTVANAALLRSALCETSEQLSPEPSWRSANLGRSAARTALRAAGITPATCENATRPAIP